MAQAMFGRARHRREDHIVEIYYPRLLRFSPSPTPRGRAEMLQMSSRLCWYSILSYRAASIHAAVSFSFLGNPSAAGQGGEERGCTANIVHHRKGTHRQRRGRRVYGRFRALGFRIYGGRSHLTLASSLRRAKRAISSCHEPWPVARRASDEWFPACRVLYSSLRVVKSAHASRDLVTPRACLLLLSLTLYPVFHTYDRCVCPWTTLSGWWRRRTSGSARPHTSCAGTRRTLPPEKVMRRHVVGWCLWVVQLDVRAIPRRPRDFRSLSGKETQKTIQ